MTPFATALVDARLSAGEADRLERMVSGGCDKMLSLRRIVLAREEEDHARTRTTSA
jgi:hypothetical protein